MKKYTSILLASCFVLAFSTLTRGAVQNQSLRLEQEDPPTIVCIPNATICVYINNTPYTGDKID